MRQLQNGTYQIDGLDLAALITGPVMILFGLAVSPFFLFAGVGLLLLVAWGRPAFKVTAVFLAIVLLGLIGFFNLLIAPVQLLSLLFGVGPAALAYISLIPLIFTGAISIFGAVCAIKQSEKLANAATVAFFICAFLTAGLLSIPPIPPIDFTSVIWVFLVNFIIMQFGYVLVFSAFYYSVHFAHRAGRKYLKHLQFLAMAENPDLLDEEERKWYAAIFHQPENNYPEKRGSDHAYVNSTTKKLPKREGEKSHAQKYLEVAK